jgi:hypothetical protein
MLSACESRTIASFSESPHWAKWQALRPKSSSCRLCAAAEGLLQHAQDVGCITCAERNQPLASENPVKAQGAARDVMCLVTILDAGAALIACTSAPRLLRGIPLWLLRNFCSWMQLVAEKFDYNNVKKRLNWGFDKLIWAGDRQNFH